ncbi:MAG: twin-arginine translocase TatA/TatE family subunit [Candidatus Dormibacteria bacterium]
MGISHLPILLILAVVALIVFGPKRLPELGHGLGKAITEFKKGAADLTAAHDHMATSDVAEPVPALTAAHPDAGGTVAPVSESSRPA